MARRVQPIGVEGAERQERLLAAAVLSLMPFRMEARKSPVAAHLKGPEIRWAVEAETIFLAVTSLVAATLNAEPVRSPLFPENVFFQVGQALGVVLEQYDDAMEAMLVSRLLDGLNDGMEAAQENPTIAGHA